MSPTTDTLPTTQDQPDPAIAGLVDQVLAEQPPTTPTPTDEPKPEQVVPDEQAILDADAFLAKLTGTEPPKAEETPKPAETPEPEDPPKEQEPDPLPNAKNIRALREGKKQAEAELAQLRQELEELRTKASTADLTAKEKAQLAAEKDQLAKDLQAAREKTYRLSARETPEYQQTQQNFVKGFQQIAALAQDPVFKEAGLATSPELLLGNNRQHLNEVIAALHGSNRFAEASDLTQTLNAMQVWRQDLQRIEQEWAAKNQTWEQDFTGQLAQTLARTRDDLRTKNNIPADDDHFKLLDQEATAAVNDFVTKARHDPHFLAEGAYRNALAIRALHVNLTETTNRLQQAQAAEAKLKAELLAYQRAAGAGTPQTAPTPPTTPGLVANTPEAAKAFFEETLPGIKWAK